MEKVDSSLNLALQLSDNEIEQSESLRYGYDAENKQWTVIIKYVGEISYIVDAFPGTRLVELLNQYAIVTASEENLLQIAELPEVAFMEKPKKLYFNLDRGRGASCINTVQQGTGQREGLTGQGVYVGIIDSGIDLLHPAFLDSEGNTRIAYLWDQSAAGQEGGQTPQRYGFGREYAAVELNQLIHAANAGRLPGEDRGSGHGTAVAGVAAGNGNGSLGRRYRGVAVESELIVVKLGRAEDDFAGTTQVMAGLDYVIRRAIAEQRPIAVNLSFGNNNGAHDGRSLFENYISDLNGVWKNVIVIASGNEGDARHHASIRLREGREENSEGNFKELSEGNFKEISEEISEELSFAIGANEMSMTMQIWKQYVDDMTIQLITPSGERLQVIAEEGKAISYYVGSNRISIFYGAPSPYTVAQEIYIEWFPQTPGEPIESGIWTVAFEAERIRDGRLDLWLPTVEAVGLSTGFLRAEPDTTLTIPSTAFFVVTAGAYRTDNDSAASFSGRGNTADNRRMPTLVAPGVDVITTAVGGGYTAKTGTSIAAPFVTGSAALMMEWGIVRGNDPYLYGEKIKAYLMKGARPLPAQTEIPSVTEGWGALCLSASLPYDRI